MSVANTKGAGPRRVSSWRSGGPAARSLEAPVHRMTYGSAGRTDAKTLDVFSPDAEDETPPDVGLSAARVSQDAQGNPVVDLGPGNSKVQVTKGDGNAVILVAHDRNLVVPVPPGKTLHILGGEGDDVIKADPDLPYKLHLDGGPGNDWLSGGAADDLILGGEGNDVLIGAGGNDRVLTGPGDDYAEGGEGNDELHGEGGRTIFYGGAGDDLIEAEGSGRSYMDGGRGKDRLHSNQPGPNQLLGGGEDDQLRSDSGTAIVVGGEGKDSVTLGQGTFVLYAEPEEPLTHSPDALPTVHPADLSSNNAQGTLPGSSITVKGDAAFQARVAMDLDALRALPEGRAILISLDNSGKKTRIEPAEAGNAAQPDNRDLVWLGSDGKPGPGSDAMISYNPYRTLLPEKGDEEWTRRPPVVGLFHELCHVLDYVHGTLPQGDMDGVSNRELRAVGLPYDHDGNAETPPFFPPDRKLSENSLRMLLGLPARPKY